METYVKLDESKQTLFERQLTKILERKEVATVQMTYTEELEQRGIEEGMEREVQPLEDLEL